MASNAGYEFTAEQNETFQGLVRNMTRSGIVVAAASAILIAYHLVDLFGISLGREPSPVVYYLDLALWFLIAIMGVVIGFLLLRGTAAFSALIRTEGDDIAHLMQGVARLRGILGLIFVVAVIASLLLALSLALLIAYA